MILMDRLGPDISAALRIKEHVLQRGREHLKVEGCSVVWIALLN